MSSYPHFGGGARRSRFGFPAGQQPLPSQPDSTPQLPPYDFQTGQPVASPTPTWEDQTLQRAVTRFFGTPGVGGAEKGAAPVGPARGSAAEAQGEYNLWERKGDSMRDTNGRWRSISAEALTNMGQMAQAVVSTGRPVDAYGLAAIGGAGLGGGAAGAINPRLDEQRRRAQRMTELRRTVQERLVFEQAERQQSLRAAQEHWYRTGRPAQQASLDRSRQRNDVRADLRLHPHPFDSSNPADVELLERAAATGVTVDAERWGRDRTSHLRPVRMLDETGTRYVQGVLDLRTGEVSSVENGGQPVGVGYAQPCQF